MVKQKIYQQLAMDYHVEVEDLLSPNHIFLCDHTRNRQERHSLMRSSFFRVLCIHNKMVFKGHQDMILWCKKKYAEYPVEWFMNFSNLTQLNTQLRNFNYEISEYSHHCYIPIKTTEVSENIEKKHELIAKEIDRYQLLNMEEGKIKFKNVFSNISIKNTRGIACYKDDMVVGIAAASQTASKVWEMSVDVSSECQNQGIGKFLLNHLTNQLLDENNITYCGTCESNIASQNLILSSGYRPFWAEVLAQKVKNKEKY